MDSSVIRNKKLFEKHKRNLSGFEELNRESGIDPKGILLIPDHNVLAIAGLHDEPGRRQHLTFFQIERQLNPKSKRAMGRKSGSVLFPKRNVSDPRLSLKIGEMSESQELMQIQEVDSVRLIQKGTEGAPRNEGARKSVSVSNSGDVGDFRKNKLSFLDMLTIKKGSHLETLSSKQSFSGL